MVSGAILSFCDNSGGYVEVEFFGGLEGVVLVVAVVGVGAAETVLEVVDECGFDVAEVDAVEVGGLDLQVGVVKIFDVLELVVADLGDQVVVDLVYFLGRHEADELVVFGLQDRHGIPEISYFVLFLADQHVLELHVVLRENQGVVQHEPDLDPVRVRLLHPHDRCFGFLRVDGVEF